MAINRGSNRLSCGEVLVDMSTEIWLPVDGLEDRYEVSNFGRVKSLPKYTYSRGYPQLRKEKLLKPIVTGKGNGYLSVRLSDGTQSKLYKIHRLVAIAFVQNHLQLPIVNHKDRNTRNNRADNLEWCTNAYNIKYSAKPLSEKHKEKLRKPHRPMTDEEKHARQRWALQHKEFLSSIGKMGAERRWKNCPSIEENSSRE